MTRGTRSGKAPQPVEQSIRAGEKTPSLHDRAEMMLVCARLATGLDEGAQRMTRVAIALVGPRR
jgi:hypothetical protein